MGLGHHSAELRHGLDEQDTGHQRSIWKVTRQKRLFPAKQVMCATRYSGNEFIHFINETKFGTMREGEQGGMHGEWMSYFSGLGHEKSSGEFGGAQIRCLQMAGVVVFSRLPLWRFINSN